MTATRQLAKPQRRTTTLATSHGAVKVVTAGRRASLPFQRADGAWGVRRPRNEQEREMSSAFQKFRSVVAAPDFWYASRELPGSAAPAHRRPGRPVDHPDWLYLLVAATTSITGSQRSAIAFLADPVMWKFVHDITDDSEYRRSLGLAPLGGKPVARHHMKHFQRKWAHGSLQTHAERAKATALGLARSAASEQGLLDPAKTFDYDAPDRGQWLAFDGTVFRPASKSRPSSKEGVHRRVDPAAGYHRVGGDTRTRVYGAKVVFASVRTDDYHGRLILDFDAVIGQTKSGVGDEAATTLAITARLRPRLPGVHGLIVDSVLRGKHITCLANEGLLVVNYPHAQSNPNRRTGKRHATGRIEKSTKAHVHTHKRTGGGTCEHHIHVYGTVYHQTAFDALGQQTLEPLTVLNVEHRHNADGTHRWYHVLDVPCQFGPQKARVALFHDPRKGSGGIHIRNRGEFLRVHPTNTAQFSVLYGRRNDTESLHNQLKRYLPKMPAYGVEAQSLYLLGMVIAHNSVTRAQHLKRHGQPNALDGT
jgi:hypothetical protein